MKTLKSDERSSSSEARDAWLRQVADVIGGWLDDLGFPVPSTEIRTGFASKGSRGRTISESWLEGDTSTFVIFIRPDRDDPIDVAGAIAFQLCQIATQPKDTHGHLFRHVAISIGLKGRRAEMPPGTLFREMIKPSLKSIGPLPQAEMSLPEKIGSKTQTSRLLKVSCPTCGYVARVSRKWLNDMGPPHCPKHGPMTLDS